MGELREAYSGHESFACRYGWLPKLYDAVVEDPMILAKDAEAITRLGIGKNMVRSLRFWGDAFGLLRADGRAVAMTPFASSILDARGGRDRYVERTDTLWRLHWRLATRAGLGAWAVVFGDLTDPEVSRRHLLSLVRQRAARTRGDGRAEVSAATLQLHVAILLQTYASGARDEEAVLEDTLGCPLQELRLMRVAEVAGDQLIRVERGPKPGLGVGAMADALADHWRTRLPGSRTVSLRSLLHGRNGPGRVFKLDEASLIERLDALCSVVPSLELRDDGVGGRQLVGRRDDALTALDEVAAT